jgi:hypothetical protein
MPTPSSTIRALVDAVGQRDWTRAASLADPESLEAWHREERAELAHILAPTSPEDPRQADTAAVNEILLQNADVELRLPGASLDTIGQIASLSAREYLVRLWETLDQMFGRAEPKAPPFGITGETPQTDGAVRVHYSGYLGIGGGMPDFLETRPTPDGCRYVIVPDLTAPNFAILLAWRGVVR